MYFMNTIILENLKNEGFEIITIDKIKENNPKTNYSDDDLIQTMEEYGAQICLYNPYMALNWFFENEQSLINYFENGGQVDFDNAETFIESMDEFDIEWEKRFSNIENKPMTIEQSNKIMNEMKSFVKEWKNR